MAVIRPIRQYIADYSEGVGFADFDDMNRQDSAAPRGCVGEGRFGAVTEGVSDPGGTVVGMEWMMLLLGLILGVLIGGIGVFLWLRPVHTELHRARQQLASAHGQLD